MPRARCHVRGATCEVPRARCHVRGATCEVPRAGATCSRTAHVAHPRCTRTCTLHTHAAYARCTLHLAHCTSPPSTQEKPIRVVILFVYVVVAERIEEGLEFRHLGVGHLESRQHASEVRAVIAVMKQADVPAAAEFIQKL